MSDTKTYTIVRTGRRPAPITVVLPDGREWQMTSRRAVRDLTKEGAAAVAAQPDTRVLESRAHVAEPPTVVPKPTPKPPKPDTAKPSPSPAPKAASRRTKAPSKQDEG